MIKSPIVTAIKKLNKVSCFHFCRVNVEDHMKGIDKLTKWKAIQNT